MDEVSDNSSIFRSRYGLILWLIQTIKSAGPLISKFELEASIQGFRIIIPVRDDLSRSECHQIKIGHTIVAEKIKQKISNAWRRNQ